MGWGSQGRPRGFRYKFSELPIPNVPEDVNDYAAWRATVIHKLQAVASGLGDNTLAWILESEHSEATVEPLAIVSPQHRL